ALAAGERAHVVVRGQRIVEARLLRERPAHRDAAALLHQPGRRGALGRRDQVDRAELVVLAPAAPVATIVDQRADFLLGGQRPLGHVGILGVPDSPPAPGVGQLCRNAFPRLPRLSPYGTLAGPASPAGAGWSPTQGTRRDDVTRGARWVVD